MNAVSKECFAQLTKTCTLYSIITNRSIDESLNNVLLTDTGKSIINNNKITMNRKDKEIIKDILSELANINVVSKKYSDTDITEAMLKYNPRMLNMFQSGEWGCSHCLLN